MHWIYDNPLPNGWIEEPLGKLVQTKRGCSWTKEQERERPSATSIPVIRIPNVQKRLILDDLMHLEDVGVDQRASSAVTKGWTLMVASNGNPKRIGDAVLMEEDREMVFASFLFALRPKEGGNHITDEFLASWLRLHRVHEFVSETSQMTTGLANLSWSACRQLPVRFPQNLEDQHRITAAMAAAATQTDRLHAMVDASRLLEASVAKDLLTGNLLLRA